MTSPHKQSLRVLLGVRDEGLAAALTDQIRMGGLGWEITVLGKAALDVRVMEESAVDVVLVDGRSGEWAGELLVALRSRWPMLACVSIGGRPVFPRGPLPGFATTAVVAEGAPAAELFAAVERAYTLARVLGRDVVQSSMARFSTAPQLAESYGRLRDAVARSETSEDELARVAELDAEMTVKVLQIANSAFFGFSRRIASMQEAVSLLGVDVVHGLLLGAHTFAAVAESEPRGLSLDRFLRYSVRIARLARQFVADRPIEDVAFAAGVLHDLGKLVLAVSHPAEFEEVLERVRVSGESQHVIERGLVDVTHTELGAALAGSWGLPFAVVEAIAFHHTPSYATRGDTRLLAAIHAADVLTGVVYCGEPISRLDEEALARGGMLGDLARFRSLTEEQRAQLAARH